MKDWEKSHDIDVDQAVNYQPEHELFSNVLSAIASVDEQERRLEEAHEHLNGSIAALEGMGDRSERLRAVRWLYWNERRSRVPDLCVALFGQLGLLQKFQNSMRRLVGPYGTAECSHHNCKRRAVIRSRSQREAVLSKRGSGRPDCGNHAPPVLSPEQRQLQHQEWERRNRLRQEKKQKDLRELSELLETTGLPDDQLQRLYELIADDIDERRQNAWDNEVMP